MYLFVIAIYRIEIINFLMQESIQIIMDTVAFTITIVEYGDGDIIGLTSSYITIYNYINMKLFKTKCIKSEHI